MEIIDKQITKVHNYIYANDGLSNSETLNEILKIFYCKILDEKTDNILSTDLTDKEILSNMNILFDKCKKKLHNIFTSKEKFQLKNSTLIYVVREFKNICFSTISSDAKGHILQKIIDRSYRESRGQFFTPAPVVDFIVKMIEPKKGELGCDPACGTGGFLFRALEYISSSNSIDCEDIGNMYFYDISESLIKLISMRMMFEFDDYIPNFKVTDSLAYKNRLKFDYILTNPPFGTQGKIQDPDVLSKYQLGHNENGDILKSQVPDILFVEKVIQSLKIGGRAAIILPDGDLENPSLKFFRKFLINSVKLEAIISLPTGTFIPYGTGIKSSILIFTKLEKNDLKKHISQNYPVFFGQISKLGYSFSKHSKALLTKENTPDEDYSHVLDCYKKGYFDNENYLVNISDIIKSDFLLSTSFYNPVYNATIEKIASGKYALLKDLTKIKQVKDKVELDKTYHYIEISDVSSYTNEIINSSQMLGEDLPSRASYKIRTNNIIVATAGSAIGTPKHAKAIVTESYDGCICTNGFSVLECTKISPYYLLNFFNSNEFLYQVKKYKYGTAIATIGKEDFENILVPLVSEEKMTYIENNIKQALNLRNKANEILQETISALVI